MSILALIVILLILGFVAWGVSRMSAINPTFKTIIYVVLVVIAVLICLNAFGILDEVRRQPVPKL